MQLDGTGDADTRLVHEGHYFLYVSYVRTQLRVPGTTYDVPALARACVADRPLAAAVRAFADGRRGDFDLALVRRALPDACAADPAFAALCMRDPLLAASRVAQRARLPAAVAPAPSAPSPSSAACVAGTGAGVSIFHPPGRAALCVPLAREPLSLALSDLPPVVRSAFVDLVDSLVGDDGLLAADDARIPVAACAAFAAVALAGVRHEPAAFLAGGLVLQRAVDDLRATWHLPRHWAPARALSAMWPRVGSGPDGAHSLAMLAWRPGTYWWVTSKSLKASIMNEETAPLSDLVIHFSGA